MHAGTLSFEFPPASCGWFSSARVSPAPARMSPPPAAPTDYTADAARDVALLRRIADGDQTALASLYDHYSRPLFALAVRILNDSREAEDIVHDGFLSVWEKARDFDHVKGAPFSWIVTMVRNRAIDRLRSRKRRAELLAASAPADLGYDESLSANEAAESAERSESSAAIRQAVHTLPPEQRQALELAFFSGLTQQEIAARLQQPLGTIKARIRRGLLKLRDLVSPPQP